MTARRQATARRDENRFVLSERIRGNRPDRTRSVNIMAPDRANVQGLKGDSLPAHDNPAGSGRGGGGRRIPARRDITNKYRQSLQIPAHLRNAWSKLDTAAGDRHDNVHLYITAAVVPPLRISPVLPCETCLM